MKEQKKTLRKSLRNARKLLSQESCAASDTAICKCILSHDIYRDATCILLYAAVQNEVDLTEVALSALAVGKAVGYPRVGGDGKMRFHAVSSLSDLAPDAYGIPAPHAAAPVICPDTGTMMLIPALAYDADGYRLGQGGGYYDRYLAAYPGAKVGVIREDGFLPVLPHETHDKRVDVIITEKQIYKVK